MANNTPITIIGNLGDDPQLRFTQSGTAVVNLSVAVTERIYDRRNEEWVDGDVAWYRCTAWGDYAEHVAESLVKGDHVIITGALRQRIWEDNDGNARTSVEINIDEAGPSLRFGTTKFSRVRRSRNNTRRNNSKRDDQKTEQTAQQTGGNDPWAGTAPNNEEPPF